MKLKKLASNKFFFYELHIFNLPLAIFLKLFGDVYVFKYLGKCQYFLKNNFLPSIDDFKDVDQWVEAKKLALNQIQKYFTEILTKVPRLSVNETNLDLSRLYVQRICIDYEAYLLFVTLVNNYSGRKFVINYFFRKFLKNERKQLISHEESDIRFLSFGFLNLLYVMFATIIDFMKNQYRLFLYKSSNFDRSNYKYICSGISAGEHPENDDNLDFAWLVNNTVLNSKDVLYILESEPNPGSKSFLISKKINFTTKSALYASLTISKKFSIFLSQLFFLGKRLPTINYSEKFLADALFQSTIWMNVLEEYKPTHFIYSFSCGWPEQFNTLACKALNIKSIMWFYSAGEFLYSNKNKNFKDLSVRYSIFESDELWVWNNLVKEIFSERLLIKADAKKIFVVGAVLNGDWGVLSATREATPFTIGVFDLTPMKARMRLNYGEGPFCSSLLQQKFYEGVLKIHHAFPNVRIIIKAKRNPNPLIYDDVPALKSLVDLKSDRIEFLPSNSNPYSAIANSDLVISTPFTSPTMLALSLGKNGIYYDPIQLCNHTFKEAFADITINDECKLLSFVELHSNKKLKNQNVSIANPYFKKIMPSETLSIIKERLGL